MDVVTHVAEPEPAAGDRSHIRLSRVSDELLARQAARGGDRAFTAIYERYHQPLYRYCRSIVRDDPDAQDALQSTFTKALQALRQAKRNAPLRPWLYRIAHNESVSVIRRRHRDRPPGSESLILGADQPALSAAGPEETVALKERWATLIGDLAELPERQRGALLLRELSGLPHEEIAIALGTSAGAAKQSIFEARQALAEFAEGRDMLCEDVRQRISEGDGRVLRGRRLRAHLRGCRGCTAFAAGIRDRQVELRAFAPVLPALAAGAVLSRAFSAASSHAAAHSAVASGALASGGAASSGVAGKVVGGALIWKAAAGVAVIATSAAVGVTALHHGHTKAHHQAVPAATSTPASGSGAGAATGTGSSATQGASTAPNATAGHHGRHGHRSRGSSAAARRSAQQLVGTKTEPGALRAPAALSHGAGSASHGATRGASGSHTSSAGAKSRRSSTRPSHPPRRTRRSGTKVTTPPHPIPTTPVIPRRTGQALGATLTTSLR